MEEKHSPEIFISYRRGDASGFANPLYQKLASHFGPEHVFRDVRNIEAGELFVDRFNDGVNSCKVFLPIIGTNWLTLAQKKKAEGLPDYVQLEIARALTRLQQSKDPLVIVPVLVEGATMPLHRDLPDDLKGIADINAFELVESWWEEGVAKLILQIEKSLENFDIRLDRPANEVIAPDQRLQTRVRYLVSFALGTGVAFASYLVPLFRPVLSLIPDSTQASVLLLCAAVMGSLAIVIQWYAREKLTRQALRRQFKRTLAGALLTLVGFSIVQAFVVVTLPPVQGESQSIIVGLSRRVTQGCPAEISDEQCIKNVSTDPAEIAKVWGDNQIKLASTLLVLLYLALISSFATLLGLLVAWKSR